ncbi:hypothetical protein TUM4438_44130 [Shewanella sairae]|uniref:Bacterial sugar transferase domain-containing protein n=3 Tax=Shewanella sairae TaxID=190310 RepID=A0ABQ4PRD6_9GAMM|nr:hypothetical protein TUM4438_44130 [Shewanella sairae]
MLYGFIRSWMAKEQIIELVYTASSDGEQVALKQFSYSGRFQKLPMLFNLLHGQVSLLGSAIVYVVPATSHSKDRSKEIVSQAHYIANPGLISIEQLNSATGLNFEQSTISLTRAHSSLIRYLFALLRNLMVSMTTGIFCKKSQVRHSQTSVFGINLTNWSMEQLLAEIHSQASTPQAPMRQYSFVNADCLNISTRNAQYRQCLLKNQQVFADGIGVRLACSSKGAVLKDNLNGTDMFPRLCQLAAANNLSIYLLGASDGVAQQAAENMQSKYPQLSIAGCHSGFFDSQTHTQANQDVIEKINQSGADILLVAMGAPKQELWLEANKAALTCKVGIGVGGLFDFYAQRIKRAPLWLRQMGLEWTYRLLQEPKRMWKRYIIGNPSFLLKVYLENRQLAKRERRLFARATPTLSKQQLLLALNKSQTLKQSLPMFNSKQANVRRAKFNLALKLQYACKRMLDILVSSVLLVLLSPLLLLTSLLIRIESPGAALFSQVRAGLNNRSFTMWKFRSMYQDAEQRLAELNLNNEMAGGMIFKIQQDPRITCIGRFIRKTSIDELPQLWNVLRGDMSLVGPRPALSSEVKQYSQYHRGRLAVKPGITCIWQVSGRSTIPFERQVELDIDYIYQQSFTADLWLLIKTIPAVIFARGAY